MTIANQPDHQRFMKLFNAPLNSLETGTIPMNTMKNYVGFCHPWTVAFVFLVALAWCAPAARAANANPPERISYQGYLVDAAGVALGNTAPKNFEVVFRIFDSVIAGNKKWTEQQTVTVDKGYFSVLLGEGSAVGSETRLGLSTVFVGADASDRFMEITVKGIGSGGTDSTVSPRLRVLTSPYSFLARQANSIVNEVGTSLLVANGTDIAVTGNVVGTATVKAPTITATGTVKGDTIDGTTLVKAPTITATGTVKGEKVEATGNVTAQSITAKGLLQGDEVVGMKSIIMAYGGKLRIDDSTAYDEAFFCCDSMKMSP